MITIMTFVPKSLLASAKKRREYCENECDRDSGQIWDSACLENKYTDSGVDCAVESC